MHNVPKKIWMLWFQGWDDAPPIVQACVRSWEQHNPDWEIVKLDAENLSSYVDIDWFMKRKGITVQSKSNIVRIALLQQHGGVWADATCFCTKPLDDWLPEAAKTGYFAFAQPAVDRPISSWFMVAEPGNYLVDQHAKACFAYWRTGPAAPYLLVKVFQKLCWILLDLKQVRLVQRSVRWSKRWFGVYAMFVFHYLFQQLLEDDERFAEEWAAASTISADVGHYLFNYGITEPYTQEQVDYIAAASSGVYKLSWRIDTPYPAGSVIEHVVQSTQ